MKGHIVICIVILTLLIFPVFISAQEASSPQKFALVIGNGSYTGLTPLSNPVNDADDMTTALEYMGFTVDKVRNGSLEQMEEAVIRLQNRLSGNPNSYGFFFYAGHGVQSGGENYLIPVDTNIPSESFLRSRSVSVQAILDELNEARNYLNVVVLDACRDNPFGWARNTSRGLAIIAGQPADSIIVYATSAGQRAFDGNGRNGVFTTQLLKNLMTPDLEVTELFRRTGADVAEASNREQIPAIYNQFFGTAYLGTVSEEVLVAAYRPAPAPSRPATQPFTSSAAGDREAKLWTVGASFGSSFATPWIIGTVRGTIAPFNFSFLELGFDIGFVSEVKEVDHLSLCPFVHYAYYRPVRKLGGWYIGAGGGYMLARFIYTEGDVQKYDFVLDGVTGFNFFGFLDLSYTLRTNFSGISNKFSVGYTYRF